MKKILLASIMVLTINQFAVGQNAEDNLQQVKHDVVNIQTKQVSMQNTISANRKDIAALKSENKLASQKIDSLHQKILTLNDSLSYVNRELKKDISLANNTISKTEEYFTSTIKSKTILGVVIIAILSFIVGLISFLLRRKVNSSANAIENVKTAQIRIQEAQKKIEEESIQLDNKLIELIEKKINIPSETTDHTLALKVADEITRIELNLSRMDSSIKGYKQLTKGIERIKNNFLAKGYEIADMLGKQYNEGMRINADFVLDENLEAGMRTITSITKPQVTYNGEMIQKAIVTVTQNI